ncbi:MAG: carbohydrate binding family 9 domain-containing protein [Saprospiraceae bacterium]|nr:carbohydrate binding family 9 domain-containing protein [Saprospiraceae bacterium]MCB9320088.1 carbohydrate binding family 9 domain-containing protein [Lewinellaceae bacterium]
MHSQIIFSFMAFLLAVTSLSAADFPIPLKQASEPITIDGRLDDPAWKHAFVIQDFKTIQPDFGLLPSEQTTAYLTYDQSNIYFAAYCYDSQPSRIKASLSARDQVDGDDWVAFCLDADNDELSSYFFLSNPLGIQADGTLDASASPDALLDMVWQSASQETPDGYIVEMAIPLNNLRFSNRDTLTMGFKIARYISRKSEEDDFPEYRPERGAALTQFQKITVTGIKSKNILEILPAVTLGRHDQLQAGKLESGAWKADVGVTAKIGITSSLTLDATYNPDFSQVESDASQIDVNLRSALFYPEKRPFFQEGQDLFGFSASLDGTYLQQLVNTRSIVDPQVGLKLTGRINQKNVLAALYALDQYPGTLGDNPTGKDAHFSVLRYGRLLKSDSYLGGFFTGWNYDGQSNYVAGADGRLRTGNKSRIEFHGFRSFSRGEEHQQGHAIGTAWRYDARDWNFHTGIFDVSENFNTRLGYVTRTGITTIPMVLTRNFYYENKRLQRLSPYIWSRNSFDHAANLWETLNSFGIEMGLPRQSEITVSAWLGNEVFAGQQFSRNALRFVAASQPYNWLGIGMEWRYGRAIYYNYDDPLGGNEQLLGASIRLQPFAKLSSQVNVRFGNFYRKGSQEALYSVTIWRNSTVWQFNKYLFFRAISEFNVYTHKFREDLLLSFTWIPGTVIYLGYGSQFEKQEWNGMDYIPADQFLQSQGTWFFKASYRWQRK